MEAKGKEKKSTKEGMGEKSIGENRYLKKQIIGYGGQGKVWLVENINTKALSVMKIYEKENGEAEREIEILRRFGGKGIPYLVDCVKEHGETGIIMEYVEGKTLRSLFGERKIWSEKEAIALMEKVARILSVFHRQVPQIIYGDLKPENIMVTPEGEVYLIDFGSVLYKGERERRVFGTREYLPPSEEGRISAYRDTYGLGVIMYEMLTGSVLSKGIAGGKADVSHLSPACRQIMQRAVKIHETEGYGNGGELYEDLKAYMEKHHKERKERKKRMFWSKSRKKKDYFISDLRRLVCTGAVRGICLLLACFAAMGMIWGASEVKGAGIEEAAEEKVTIERVVVKNYAESNAGKEEITGVENRKAAETETAGVENARVTAEENAETEILRDEYGRKLIVKTERSMENPGR